MENGLYNFRKIICGVANGVLGKEVRNAARHISEKASKFNRQDKGLIQELSDHMETKGM